jgi:iron complex transport system substrate-binding protein
VVSLLPAATEIVAALGLEDLLVGRSHECDSPSLAHLPALTSSSLDPGKPSGALDSEVRLLLAAGQPLFSLDRDGLEAVAPDLVLTQGTCPVCAIAFDQVQEALRRAAPHAEVVSLSPTRLEHILGNILETARALGAEERGRELISTLKARLEAIPPLPRPPRVVVIEWLEPPMEAGHWTGDVVQASGGDYLGPEAGGRALSTTWEKVKEKRPDALVVAPCGLTLRRTVSETGPLSGTLRGIAPRILLMDGNRYLSRPGPGIVEAAEVLAAWLARGEIRGPYAREMA